MDDDEDEDGGGSLPSFVRSAPQVQPLPVPMGERERVKASKVWRQVPLCYGMVCVLRESRATIMYTL